MTKTKIKTSLEDIISSIEQELIRNKIKTGKFRNKLLTLILTDLLSHSKILRTDER